MHIYLIKIANISRSSVEKRRASRATMCGRVWVNKLRGGIRLQNGGVRWFTIAILIISAYKHKLTTLYERCMNAIVKTKRSERVDIFYLHIFKETHFYISSGHSQTHWAAQRRSPIGRRATPLCTLIGPGRWDPQKPCIMGGSPRRSSFQIIKRWVSEATVALAQGK